MKPTPDRVITFHIEPADRGVGIMCESFSAWASDALAWCQIEQWEEDPTLATFAWFGNETGDAVVAPPDAAFIEAALHAYALAYYRYEQD